MSSLVDDVIFLYLAKTRPSFSYVDSQLFIKRSTKVKIKKNDETVISLSVPPTVFQLVALLKSKSHHKYDDLKKKSDSIKLCQEKMYKESNRRIQTEKHEGHWSFI